mgnify:CR=1 FL=1
MADDRAVDAELAEHRRGDLAGERALSAPSARSAPRPRRPCRPGAARRPPSDVNGGQTATSIAVEVRLAPPQLDAELGRLGRALVHLPVACDQHATPPGSRATPGNSFPSRSSREAPAARRGPVDASTRPISVSGADESRAADHWCARRPSRPLPRPPSCPRRSAAILKTPIGPFQKTVLAPAIARARTPRGSPGRCRARASRQAARRTGTTFGSASSANSAAATTSVGSSTVERERVLVAHLLGHLRRRSAPWSALPPRFSQHPELVLDLRPAGDEDERALDLAEQLAQLLELALEQEPRVGREQLRDADRRRARGAPSRTRRSRTGRGRRRARGRVSGSFFVSPGIEARVLEHADAFVRAAAPGAGPRPASSRTRGSSPFAAGRDASRRRPRRPRAPSSSSSVGSEARIRVSSATRPSSSGTLRSRSVDEDARLPRRVGAAYGFVGQAGKRSAGGLAWNAEVKT